MPKNNVPVYREVYITHYNKLMYKYYYILLGVCLPWQRCIQCCSLQWESQILIFPVELHPSNWLCFFVINENIIFVNCLFFRNSTITLERSDYPANMTVWPEFHNGVAAALKIDSGTENVSYTYMSSRTSLNGHLV